MHSLILERNKLSDIKPGALKNLTNVISIDLQNNKLTENLDPKVFENLDRLELLYLGNNQGHEDIIKARLERVLPRVEIHDITRD